MRLRRVIPESVLCRAVAALVFVALPSITHAQYQRQAIDDFDRTLRRLGAAWSTAEKIRIDRLVLAKMRPPYRQCVRPWTTWGNLLEPDQSHRIANPWGHRVYDAQEDFGLLVHSAHQATAVCVEIDSTVAARPSVPGRLGADSHDTTYATAKLLGDGMDSVRAKIVQNGRDPVSWRALLYLALLKGDTAVMRSEVAQCGDSTVPCDVWKTWVERLVAPDPLAPPSYGTIVSAPFWNSCLARFTHPPPLRPKDDCNPVADEAEFWWAADPFWSDEVNERLDAHIDRSVFLRLADILRFDGRTDWRVQAGGDALREAVIRFGWPNRMNLAQFLKNSHLSPAARLRMWFSIGPSMGSDHEWVYSPHVVSTVPRSPDGVNSTDRDQHDWSTAVRRRDDVTVTPLQHVAEWWSPPCPIKDVYFTQRAVLRRRNEHVLLATTKSEAIARAVLISSRGPNHAVHQQPVSWWGERSTVATAAIDTAAVAFSVERAFSPSCEPVAARSRFGAGTVAFPAQQSFAISAPLRLHGLPAPSPAVLTDSTLLTLASADSTVRVGEPITAYFEAYGTDDAAVTITVTVQPRLAVGALRSIGVRTGMATDPNAKSSVSFEISTASSNRVRIVNGRADDLGVVVELATLGFQPGDYEVAVTAEQRGRRVEQSARVRIQ
jgi:hypothetical protein